MIEARALLATASKLLESEPSEVDVRRSVSTAYYALFHHVCWHFSDIILQPQSGAYERARLQAYRYLDHGVAKVRCNEATAQAKGFPAGIVEFAEAFIDLQQLRHAADYDPKQRFVEADARTLIVSAEAALMAFDAEPVEARRAFVVFLGLRPRGGR